MKVSFILQLNPTGMPKAKAKVKAKPKAKISGPQRAQMLILYL
jgi:hypothetical protein